MSQPVQIQIYRDGQLTGDVMLDGSKKVNKIGKTSSAQIKIDDPQASRVHAVIELSHAGPSLIDMGSAVGTLLNGERVNKAPLSNGDKITIGSSELVVTIGAEVAALRAEASAPAAPGIPASPFPPPDPTPAGGIPAVGAPPYATTAGGISAVGVPRGATPAGGIPAVGSPPHATPAGGIPAVGVPRGATPVGGMPAAGAPNQPTPAGGMPVPPDGTPAGGVPTVPPAGGPFGPPPSSLGPLQAPATPPNGLRPAAFGPSAPTDIRDIDTALSESDPAVRRLQQSARRNRLIGAGVILGVIVVTGLLVVLGRQGDAPSVEEPANYSASGVESSTPGGTAAAKEGSGPAEEGKPPPAFDPSVPRDEEAYAYETLTSAETLAAIAQRRYGNPARVDLVRGANPLVPADEPLVVGTEVRLPRFVVHEVVAGDTLGEIAKLYLGDATLYEQVFVANRDVLASPTAVDVGMKLKIPILTAAP